jgi:transposase InsO family protein
MEEYGKTGVLKTAALRADMDEKTARKYLRAGKLPSQMRVRHTWRTRKDPFEAHWSEAERMLEALPELEAKELFEWLCDRHPDVYQDGQVRTFQRRVRRWRALNGPEKEVFFGQEHHPGRRMSTDFTHAGELGVTIGGEAFDHLLCHCVLTYSNWEWATICHSESMLALRVGIQSALFHLGRVPEEHWTDHSSAATHRPGEDADDGSRKFNDEYLAVMEHFGLRPRTIRVDSPHENGDVESLNGALKRRIKQRLLLRGSSDFVSIEEYQSFLEQVVEKVNKTRTKRLADELTEMKLLTASRLAEHKEYRCPVRNSSTITVERRIYSVPSRLIGETVQVRRYQDHLEAYFAGELQLEAPWIGRDQAHYIDYRHIIHWLVRKPGAFSNYRYRSDLFPTESFRWAYDTLKAELADHAADLEYLQILHHAALTMECEVDQALRLLRCQSESPRLTHVLERTRRCLPAPPALPPLAVELSTYDELLGGKVVAA